MFRLGKLEFKVKEGGASLRGGFYDGAMSERMQLLPVPQMNWYIDIDLERGDFIYELTPEDLEDLEEGEEYIYESVAPRLYHNNGFELDITSWKDIEGITLNWDSECNEKGEEAGYLYVFEHEDVTKGKIEFLKRNGTQFFVRWSGTANVYWNEEYGADVPFLFEGEVNFDGISAHCDKIKTMDELVPVLQQFVNLDEYKCVSQDSYKIQKGTSYSWRFIPQNIH